MCNIAYNLKAVWGDGGGEGGRGLQPPPPLLAPLCRGEGASAPPCLHPCVLQHMKGGMYSQRKN